MRNRNITWPRQASAARCSWQVGWAIFFLVAGVLLSDAVRGAQIPDAMPIDLTGHFNNDGISWTQKLDDGDFVHGILYPAESLPTSGELFLVGGVPFRFPAKEDGQLNNLSCAGQRIDLPDQRAGAVYCLGASDGRRGGRPSTHVTLRYTDGALERHLLCLTSWEESEPQYGNVLAVQTKGFHVQNRIARRAARSMFVAAIYPRRQSPLEELILGHEESLHIFALTLAKQVTLGPGVAVDELDWGAGRAGENRVTVTLRGLAGGPRNVQVEWRAQRGDEEEVRRDRIRLPAGEVKRVSIGYSGHPGTSVNLSLTILANGHALYVARKGVYVPPVVSVDLDRRLYMSGVSHGEVTAKLGIDVADLPATRVVFERTDATGEDAQHIAEVSGPPTQRVRISLPLEELEPGLYKIRVRVLHDNEQIGQAESVQFEKVTMTPAPISVSFDDDGTMLVEGERFFPLGMISAGIDSEGIAELLETGFNYVHLSSGFSDSTPIGQVRPALDACEQAGLKVILSLKGIRDLDWIKHMVLTYRDHPALISWHFLEEPIGQAFTPDDVDAAWKLAKSLDPYHPLDLIDWSYAALDCYAPWVSIVMPDRYPVGHYPPQPVVEAIREQVKAAAAAAQLRPKAPAGRKPVWACLQTENLGSDFDRPPTDAEMRAMIYEAVVAGAQGIDFYDFPSSKRYKTWEPIARTIGELHSLLPVLLERNPVRRAKCEGPIDTWLRRHDGYDYLIAVNEKTEPVTAHLSLPGAEQLGRVQVLFEDRDVQAEAGGFTDEFEPYGVHVYKIEADTAQTVYEVYGVYPYSVMDRHNPGFVRQESPVTVSLAGGEFEPVCLVVDNRHPDADTFDFRVEVRSALPAEQLRLGRLAYLPPRGGNQPALARETMNGLQEAADVIIPLSQFEPVTVAAGECRHLWLTVDARDLEPGNYSAEAVIRPMTARADRRPREAKLVKLNIRAWPFALPEELPITVFTWDQGMALSSNEWLANFREHRINAFHIRMDTQSNESRVKLNPDGTLAEQPDFSELTERLLRGKPHARLFMFESFRFRGGDWPSTDDTSIPYMSPEWQKGFTQWFQAFSDYLQGLGIGTDQWVWYSFDEAFFQGGEKASLQQAQLVHELNPNTQFFMDTWPSGEAQLEPWQGLNVIWCPDYGIYGLAPWSWIKDHQDAEQQPTWMYSCHDQTRGFQPHSFYRCRGWLTWIYGLDGMSYWATPVHTGSQWNDLDGPRGDTCTVLTGEDGQPVNTRRFDAYRDGIEDYLYVCRLDELLSQPGVDSQTVEEGRELLEAASEEYATIGDWRYLGERRKRWQVTEEIVQRTEAQRQQMGELITRLVR